MVLRVVVNGAFGKMGQIACQTIQQQKDMLLLAALGRQDDLAQVLAEQVTDVVVDLTSADSVLKNAQIIVDAGVRPVIGTSGLLADEICRLQEQCLQQGLGGIIVPNFSIGAILMMHFSALAARYIPDVEIIEAHHPKKADAPSGTAMKTASEIVAARIHSPMQTHCKEILAGARGANIEGIPLHSIRLNGFLAQQEVIFGQAGETLSIKHQSMDRTCFMPGLLLAIRGVMSLNQLLYGLEHLIALK